MKHYLSATDTIFISLLSPPHAPTPLPLLARIAASLNLMLSSKPAEQPGSPEIRLRPSRYAAMASSNRSKESSAAPLWKEESYGWK